jgi:hypothetical protein
MPQRLHTPEELSARGKLARFTALHGPDHPATDDARVVHRSERYLAAVKAAVDAAPPVGALSAEQRDRLRSLLAPVASVLIGQNEVSA